MTTLSSTHTGDVGLDIRNLTIDFSVEGEWKRAISDVSFSIGKGEVFGLVGESGSGKSVSAMSILGLLPQRSTRIAPESKITLGDTELTTLDNKQRDKVRGNRVGTIFQEPMTSLNPSFTIGDQIAEGIRRHQKASKKDAWNKAIALLDRVGIPSAQRNVEQYPHHFSGGMRQRAMIAMSLACEPELLIADEPTTALDVTVQAQILDLIRSIQEERQMSVLLITHDLAVISEIAHRVGVMYSGELVEESDIRPLLDEPRHPYTSGLLSSILKVGDSGPLHTIPGSIPTMGTEIPGCRFQERCRFAVESCGENRQILELVDANSTRSVRCQRHTELDLPGVKS